MDAERAQDFLTLEKKVYPERLLNNNEYPKYNKSKLQNLNLPSQKFKSENRGP